VGPTAACQWFACIGEPRARDRRAGLATVPSTIADELRTNPFMRVGESVVSAYAQREHPVDVMAEIRRLKTEWGRRK
jgi:hydroxyacylglutathione hydrolase